MVSLIATAAKAEHVGVFHRFELMRRWREIEHLPFETFVSTDGLHMNDWSYACLAKALGVAIAEAATRPTATAVGPRPRAGQLIGPQGGEPTTAGVSALPSIVPYPAKLIPPSAR